MWKGKIVDVVKASRIKYNRAPKGTSGYVVAKFTNSWGTNKLIIVDAKGDEYCTTTESVIISESQNLNKFEFGIKKWTEKTHYPIIFETTIVPRNPNKKAICCRIISKKEEQWIPLSVLRDENFNSVTLNSFQVDKCYSGYIPMWTAKKMGLVSSDTRT